MMTRPLGRRVAGVSVGLALALTACGAESDSNPDAAGDDSGTKEDSSSGEAASGTVTVEHAQGTDQVPVGPDTVVALSNRDFSTLSAFGAELAAAPVALMGDGAIWPEYADVPDVGNHREPDLEQVIAAGPDLIITGSRFGSFYDDLVADNPDAVVIDTTPDTEADDIGDDMKHFTEVLGQIFDAEDEAAEIVAAYDDAVADAQEAYDGQSTVMGLITSGNAIQYAAPVDGRSIGPLFPLLHLVPAIDQEAEDTSHGDEISVEAIADADPDWMIVLDRDGATSADESGGYQPAQEIIGSSEVLQSTTAVAEDQIVHLDPSFYLTEDIQAYTDLFEQLADAFSGDA